MKSLKGTIKSKTNSLSLYTVSELKQLLLYKYQIYHFYIFSYQYSLII